MKQNIKEKVLTKMMKKEGELDLDRTREAIDLTLAEVGEVIDGFNFDKRHNIAKSVNYEIISDMDKRLKKELKQKLGIK